MFKKITIHKLNLTQFNKVRECFVKQINYANVLLLYFFYHT